MTLKELSQLYYLDREIELDRERLAELRANLLCPRSPNYDGMPHSPQAKIEQRIYERSRLERYISDIPDSLTRQIFTLRFIEGLTWEDVADKIGSSSYSVKHICYRFIAKN